jgi:hypothetical protein
MQLYKQEKKMMRNFGIIILTIRIAMKKLLNILDYVFIALLFAYFFLGGFKWTIDYLMM